MGVLKPEVLGKCSLEALDRGPLWIIDDSLAEGNGVVEALEDGIAVTSVSVLEQHVVSLTRWSYLRLRIYRIIGRAHIFHAEELVTAIDADRAHVLQPLLERAYLRRLRILLDGRWGGRRGSRSLGDSNISKIAPMRIV